MYAHLQARYLTNVIPNTSSDNNDLLTAAPVLMDDNFRNINRCAIFTSKVFKTRDDSGDDFINS